MTVPPPPGRPADGQLPDGTAVMGRRFAAWVIDLLLFVGVLVASFVALAEWVPAAAIPDACERLESRPDADIASCLDLRELGIAELEDRVYVTDGADAGVQTLVSLGYFVFFVVLQGATGGSPGKLLAGVRVVDEHGRRPGFGKSLGRTLLWAVDAAPWIVPLVGPIVALTTTGHRRVGDMAASTYVVSRSHMGRPVLATGVTPPPGQAAWGAGPPDWPGAPPARPPSPTLPGPDAPAPEPPASTPAPPEVELDIRSLDVPPPTDRADESPPHIGADPRWWDDPSLHVEPPPGADDPSRPPDEQPGYPTWEPPTSPGVDDPMDEWRPPTGPGVDDYGAPPEAPAPPTAPWDPSTDDPGATAMGRQRADEHPGEPPGGPAPFVPPGGEPENRDAGVTDPWGTGTSGTAGSGSVGGGPARHELPPPQWDEARNTYIQWDPNRAAWLQWDQLRQRWKPIDT